MHEIERKFLVTKPLLEIIGGRTGKLIEQCYLYDTGEWTIRVRRTTSSAGQVACVQTMKRRINDRRCIELEEPVSEEYFFKVASVSGPMLEKQRFAVPHGSHLWDVDHFGQFDGLVVAEIELATEDEDFVRPDWLGEEVTDQKQYRNRHLAQVLEQLTKQHNMVE